MMYYVYVCVWRIRLKGGDTFQLFFTSDLRLHAISRDVT